MLALLKPAREPFNQGIKERKKMSFCALDCSLAPKFIHPPAAFSFAESRAGIFRFHHRLKPRGSAGTFHNCGARLERLRQSAPCTKQIPGQPLNVEAPRLRIPTTASPPSLWCKTIIVTIFFLKFRYIAVLPACMAV